MEAGRILLDQTDAEALIITRGREGITLVTPRKVQDFPVKPMEIVDVTGAGDTVISTLALAVANSLSIEDAISLANLAASLVVARFGAASLVLDEMINALREKPLSNKTVALEDIGEVFATTEFRDRRSSSQTGALICFMRDISKSCAKRPPWGRLWWSASIPTGRSRA